MARKKAPATEGAPPKKLENNQLQVVSETSEIEDYAADSVDRLVESLKEMSEIVNDDGEKVDFSEKDREEFIEFFYDGYEIFHGMMNSIHRTGEFLTSVRDALKPRKLFLTWLNYAGIPSSTAYQYIRLHERFQEDLPQYSQIGVKKLLAVAKLPDCKNYVRENAQEIALKPATKVIEEVRQKLKEKLRQGRKNGKVGRRRMFAVWDGIKVRWSGDGTKVVLEDLNKDLQVKVLRGIKELLSQLKR